MEKHINNILNLPSENFEEVKPQLIQKALNHERQRKVIVFYSLYLAWCISFIFAILVLSRILIVSKESEVLASKLIHILLSAGVGFLLGSKE